MRHRREEVIERTIREFELLDRLVAVLSEEDWNRPLPRPAGKDPWTVKDALVHITYWKADVARSVRKQRRPPEEAGLTTNAHNRLVYERWRDRLASDVLAWHRQVQVDVLAALREAPEAWFSGRERAAHGPFDLDGHSVSHRERDIEPALLTPPHP
jgi:hypothetical protein